MIFATIPEFGSTCKRVFRLEGAMAQLVAHLLCKQRVAGSSPASSTTTTMNGEETWFFISESEEVVRNPLGIASTVNPNGAKTVRVFVLVRVRKRCATRSVASTMVMPRPCAGAPVF